MSPRLPPDTTEPKRSDGENERSEPEFDPWASPDVTEAILADGTVVFVLPVGPDSYDHTLLRQELLAHFTDLSEESRHRRFLAAMPQLSPSMLHRLVDTVDDVNHVALFAQALPAGAKHPVTRQPLVGTPVGIARFIRDPKRPRSADVAVTVLDDWQHRGIGKMLTKALAQAALRRGIDTFVGEVLSTNPAALALLDQVGTVTRSPVDAGIIHAEVQLRSAVPIAKE